MTLQEPGVSADIRTNVEHRSGAGRDSGKDGRGRLIFW
jgi:hypothetical protein